MFWKNFTIQCQGEFQILLEQREVQRNIDFMMHAYKCVVVFSLECIQSMMLYFHWNVFDIHIQMLSDYTLI